MPSPHHRPIWLLAFLITTGAALGQSTPPTVPTPREEFESIARTLRESYNPYVGRANVPALRQQLETLAADVPLNLQLEARIKLVLELLKQGEVDEAVELAEEAVGLAEDADALTQFAFVLRARALAYLRKAEVENCIVRHNADCCIFPLRDGGVHAEAGPADRARQDYEAYLASFPHDLGVRWLLNVASMAAGVYPDGVPEELLIPPASFASARDVGRFRDIAPRLGVDAFNLCGGAIVDDFDGDGALDIVTTTFDLEGPAVLYRSRGDGTFEDRSAASGLDEQLGGLNCIGADYDGDGDVDVLILRGAWLFDDGRIRNSLLRNEGDGTFTDVTRAAGIAEPVAPTQAAVFGDFDGDGDLDLYVGNESRLGDPRGQFPAQLFLNQGDGTFIDGAVAAGVTNDLYCKGVTAGDIDNDGDLDLYVSNFGPNRLYRNEGNGTFTDIAPDAGVAQPVRSFATWFFDYDNDGLLDLFVAAYEAPIAAVAADHLGVPYGASPPALYHNDGDGAFSDVTEAAGLKHAYLPMGASFGDLDNDGFLDIYLATGDPSFETLMPNVMLRNDGGARFEDVTTSGGFGHLQKGHGVVFADIDDDGDQDLYHQLGGFYPGDRYHNALFLNPGHGHRFLAISLAGRQTNRAGYGARIAVNVDTPGGPRAIHRAVGSVSSFGGSPSRQEIGLGDATGIESVIVEWPVSVTRQVVRNVPLDGWIRLTEGAEGFERLEMKRVQLAE